MSWRPASIPVYRERGALQALVGRGWLPASNLYPAGPSTIVNMLAKGWLQRKQDAISGCTYRITASGESALRAQIPSKPRKPGGGRRGQPAKRK